MVFLVRLEARDELARQLFRAVERNALFDHDRPGEGRDDQQEDDDPFADHVAVFKRIINAGGGPR